MTASKRSAPQRRAAVPSVDIAPDPLPPSSEDEVEELKSPLYISLLASTLSRGAFCADSCGYENIPEENNPRPLRRQMGDKAEYWLNGIGELLIMKFPARLEFNGQFSRLGPYFNLFDSGVRTSLVAATTLTLPLWGLQIDISNLKKTRAQFELHFLAPEDEDSADYPDEAMEMSRRVLDTLSALSTAVEDRRNAGEC